MESPSVLCGRSHAGMGGMSGRTGKGTGGHCTCGTCASSCSCSSRFGVSLARELLLSPPADAVGLDFISSPCSGGVCGLVFWLGGCEDSLSEPSSPFTFCVESAPSPLPKTTLSTTTRPLPLPSLLMCVCCGRAIVDDGCGVMCPCFRLQR